MNDHCTTEELVYTAISQPTCTPRQLFAVHSAHTWPTATRTSPNLRLAQDISKEMAGF
jgi:hypothetical protein